MQVRIRRVAGGLDWLGRAFLFVLDPVLDLVPSTPKARARKMDETTFSPGSGLFLSSDLTVGAELAHAPASAACFSNITGTQRSRRPTGQRRIWPSRSGAVNHLVLEPIHAPSPFPTHFTFTHIHLFLSSGLPQSSQSPRNSIALPSAIRTAGRDGRG